MSGSELQRLVEVMDRLRSPGGCPWDAEQTHESLVKYLLEESYEFIDSVDAKDREGMREELGDVLLQVYFHSRIAQDHPTDPFSIEDVARAIADKLIRRHPHVFEGLQVSGTGEIIDKPNPPVLIHEAGIAKSEAAIERCRKMWLLMVNRLYDEQNNTNKQDNGN